jgi:hypothetical protein
MKITLYKRALFAFTVSLTVPVHAYDVRTHTAVTARATEAAGVQVESQLLQRLGILRTVPPLGTYYVDMGLPLVVDLANTNRTLRGTQDIEFNIMAAVRDGNGAGTIPNDSTVTGWIMRGGIREDDNPTEVTGPSADEPGGMFHREFGHFFDPQNNQGLTVGGVNFGPTAPNWGIDRTVAVPLTSVITRRGFNHFGVTQAREAQWRALTLKRIAPDGSLNPEPSLTGNIKGASVTLDGEQLRKAYWASMFRAVGDISHLVQDMAQPQHTRNDPHSGYGCAFGSCAGGHDSFYEKYIAARTIRTTFFNIKEGPLGGSEPGVPHDTRIAILDFDPSYPVAFNSYADFFSTGTGTANDASAKGLANYSNRGFYSAGTNIGNTIFPSPSPTGVGLGSSSVGGAGNPTALDITGIPLPVGIKIDFRTGSVNDAIGGPSAPDVKLTTTGFWDEFLTQQGDGPRYSLNYYNYDEQARLLIPRAVAYSAGLIDYFFRGQLDITPPDEGIYSIIDHHNFSGEGKTPTNAASGMQGFKTIKLKLRNSTPDIVVSGGGGTFPQIMPGGTLVAVLRFHRNLAHTDDLANEPADATAYQASRSASEEIVVSSSVRDGSGTLLAAPIAIGNTAQTYEFGFTQELPINAVDVQLQVVYRGPLGAEADAVVVQTVDISEPTYMTYMNASDYIKVGGSVYTRAEINDTTGAVIRGTTGAALRSQINPPTCIDTMTNQLTPDCLMPIAISFSAKFGASTATIATINLPNDKFYHRFVMLVPPGSPASFNQPSSPCLPRTAVEFAGRLIQTNVTTSNAVPPVTTETRTVSVTPPPTRGVRGGVMVTCIHSGDGSVDGASSAILAVMTSLTGVNLKPQPTVGFSFGAP